VDGRRPLARALRLERRRVRWFFAGLLVAIGAIDVVEAFVVHVPLRDRTLDALLPTGITEGSRTGVVVSGLVLLLLARGLARGKRVAWALTCAVLGVSAVLHLVQALQFEQAILALWVLLGLWWLQGAFRASSDVAAVKRGILAAAAGIGLAVVEAEIGSFLLRNELTPEVGVGRSLEQLAYAWADVHLYDPLSGRAHWFLDSLPWISGVLVLIGLVQLLRPMAARSVASSDDLARAREVLRRHGHNPVSWLALSPRNSFCWAADDTFVAYRLGGTVAVALGDPVGPPDRGQEAVEEFTQLCERRDWVPAFYQLEAARAFNQRGTVVIPIGSDAVVHLADFDLGGHDRRHLRQALRRCVRLGATFSLQPAGEASELTGDELRRVSQSWMHERQAPEMGFSVGTLDSLDDPDVMLATARAADGTLIAYVSWLPIPGRAGWMLDLIRWAPEMPNGTIEALIAHSLLEAKRLGLAQASLGLTVDLGVSGARPPHRFRHVYAWWSGLHRHQSLRRFKEKFGPRWETRYLTVPSPGVVPTVLAGVARVHMPDYFRLIGWMLSLAPARVSDSLSRPPLVVRDLLG
jgi:phosphatidylglycerol lysyltransferase